MLKKVMNAVAALLVSGTAASAGGLSDAITEQVVPPVVGVEEPSDSGFGWIIPLIIIVTMIGLATGSDSSDGKVVEKNG